jgi:mono/diheme cytochrome c family protein
MNGKKIAKGVGMAVVILLMGIQLVPVDRSNPEVTREIQWNSAETADIARRACYDCHSNETVWPWYAYVAPVSWRVAEHVEEGREHLNFSEWDKPQDDAEEIVEVLEEGEMPLPDYLRMHPEARLTDEELEAFIEGVEATLWNDRPLTEEDMEEMEGAPGTAEGAAEGEGLDEDADSGHVEDGEGHDDDEDEGHVG